MRLWNLTYFPRRFRRSSLSALTAIVSSERCEDRIKIKARFHSTRTVVKRSALSIVCVLIALRQTLTKAKGKSERESERDREFYQEARSVRAGCNSKRSVSPFFFPSMFTILFPRWDVSIFFISYLGCFSRVTFRARATARRASPRIRELSVAVLDSSGFLPKPPRYLRHAI